MEGCDTLVSQFLTHSRLCLIPRAFACAAVCYTPLLTFVIKPLIHMLQLCLDVTFGDTLSRPALSSSIVILCHSPWVVPVCNHTPLWH